MHTGDTINGKNISARNHAICRAAAAYSTPKTVAAATAAAEKRTVFHTAAHVCASSKTAHEEPADTALSHTAAKGSRQHTANMVNTVAVSHFSQAHIGARGGKGETDLSTATRLLQYAYKPPAAAVTASTSHTNTDARAMSNSYATSR